ncbi:MAG: CBS domain-containing protein [Oligoflexia bacterium]|nr:CBS domain-containing protein [Oligoflexia bacterium]
MFVSDIGVKPVVTVDKSATLDEVATKMRTSHVGCVVVTEVTNNKKEKPLGIITDRDLVVSAVGLKVEPERLCAQDIMATDLYTVNQDSGLAAAIRVMASHAIRRVPVVDKSGLLVGIVTSDDVLAYLTTALGALSRVSSSQRSFEGEVRN